MRRCRPSARIHHRAGRRPRHPGVARGGRLGRRHGPVRRDDHHAAGARRQGRWPDDQRAGRADPDLSARVHHRRLGHRRRPADEQPQGLHHRRGRQAGRLSAVVDDDGDAVDCDCRRPERVCRVQFHRGTAGRGRQDHKRCRSRTRMSPRARRSSRTSCCGPATRSWCLRSRTTVKAACSRSAMGMMVAVTLAGGAGSGAGAASPPYPRSRRRRWPRPRSPSSPRPKPSVVGVARPIGRPGARQRQPMKRTITAEPRVARCREPVRADPGVRSPTSWVATTTTWSAARARPGRGTTPSAMSSGTVGTLDATLAYSKGNNLHAFRMDTAGTAFAYPNYLDGPAARRQRRLGGKTTVGRSTTFDLSQRVGYDPFFSALAPSAGRRLPAPGLDQAMPTMRACSSVGRISSRSTASRRPASGAGGTRTSTSYTYGARRVQRRRARATTRRTPHRPATSAWSRTAHACGPTTATATSPITAAGDAVRPTTTHRVEGGLDIEHVIPTRRMVTWSLPAGASRLESIGAVDDQPFTTWLPTGSGSLKVALSSPGRRRSLPARLLVAARHHQRGVRQRHGSRVHERLADRRARPSTVGATYGNWRTPAASGATTTFDVYGAQVQLIQMLTDTLGVTASYAYYQHRYSDPPCFPRASRRRTTATRVRVGITRARSLDRRTVSPARGRKVTSRCCQVARVSLDALLKALRRWRWLLIVPAVSWRAWAGCWRRASCRACTAPTR